MNGIGNFVITILQIEISTTNSANIRPNYYILNNIKFDYCKTKRNWTEMN